MMRRHMSEDPTQKSLEVALLDQKIAGIFGDKPYAYVAVIGNEKPWGFGIAVEDEPGYNPVTGMEFDTKTEVDAFVDGMNMHIGLDEDRAIQIVISSMRQGTVDRRRTNSVL